MSTLCLLILGMCAWTVAPTFAPFTRLERYYVDKLNSRMAHFYWKGSSLRCVMYGDRQVIDDVLASDLQGSVAELEGSTMKHIFDLCARIEVPYVLARGNELNVTRAIIYPGTKWCGAGSVAQGWDDLGQYWETDMCCRDHDHCPDHIAVGQEKYGLYNKYIGTVSRCDCDEDFVACLKMSEHPVSDRVGKLFFNALAVPCFREEHPIVQCILWGGLSGKRCLEYELDYSQPKIWQFFDAQLY